MKIFKLSRTVGITLSFCLILFFKASPIFSQINNPSPIPYGNNQGAGNYAFINGTKLYYETYGKGNPLMLLHGNGGNIEYMKDQIEYFSKSYNVIAMDCRGRGKSDLGKDTLTYIQMTKDATALLDYLHLDSVYLIGRSDGAIISLLMGIYFPEKVKKIAAFGANTIPDTTALYPFVLSQIHKERVDAEEMIANNDTTGNWFLIKQLNRLMEFQPHISGKDLQKIKSPVLILSCDRDLIKEEHTLFIYHNIPKANLCIFPGETHWITVENPSLFNSTVEKFFSEPYKGEEIRKSW